MTQILQPGQHPDADQLSAFAEHALPPHEQQQLLAHLAACSDCRALIFLAQEAVPAAVVEPQPIPAHQPWFSLFSGWKLALPAAAALACLVLVTLHLHNQAMEDRMNAMADKTARLEPAPPPAPPLPPAQPAPLKSASAELPQPPAIVPRSVNGMAATTVDNGSLHGNAQPLVLGGLGGRSAAVSTNDLKAESTSRQSSLGSVSAGNFAAANSAPAPVAPMSGMSGPLPANPSPQTAGAAASDSIATLGEEQPAARAAAMAPRAAPSTAALHSLNQQYNAPPPAPPQQATAAAPAAVTETVTVNSAPVQLETESNATAQVISGSLSGASFGSLQSKARAAKKEPALPSRLPVVSTTANARQQLALDTAGALFRSEDAGVTWQAVPIQWTGRALKITLAPSSKPPAPAKETITAAPAAAPAAAAKAAPAPPQLFQLTNDAGQLWTSPDGQTWTRQ
jgi:hypothetical protein